VTGRACSAEAATGETTGKTTAVTDVTTGVTGAMTGKTTGATGATTGKTGAAAGPGYSGDRELDDQAGHACQQRSASAPGRVPDRLAARQGALGPTGREL
jgi:hypothetical protein